MMRNNIVTLDVIRELPYSLLVREQRGWRPVCINKSHLIVQYDPQGAMTVQIDLPHEVIDENA